MNAPPAHFEPHVVLLLHGDPREPVTRALLEGRAQLGWPMLAVPAQTLVDAVEFGGDAWTVAGRRVEPRDAAVVNRLPMDADLAPAGTWAAPTLARQAWWMRLRDELGRFAYASSLPTASSLLGCHGSLLDQWQDLPRLVPGLRVPEHAAASLPRPLHGTVHSVDRWTPYSLGRRRDDPAAPSLPASARLDFVLPEGRLVHVAQIGERMFFPNPPPTMTDAQRQAIIGVAHALAAVSPVRIVEHAFFVGAGVPVLYSSFPVPVLSGEHPLYPELVQQGLRHDIQTRGRQRLA